MDDDKEQKTIPATPRRRQKAREKGQVPRSTEVSSALILLVIFVLFLSFGNVLFERFCNIYRYFLGECGTLEVKSENLITMFAYSARNLSKFLLPFLLTIAAVGLGSSLISGGFVFSTSKLAPDLGKLNPIKGFKKLFSTQSFFTLGKSLLKLAIVGGISWITIKSLFPCFLSIVGSPAESQAILIGKHALTLTLRVSLAFLALAALDFAFQKWDHEKSIRMTPQELKEERKEYEGAPEIKSRIRRKQIELARRRMMKEVPEATVVITNPTLLAIALKYEPKKHRAPLVIAKGGGLIAERIRKIARKYDIPVVENKPLAKLLFRLCNIGEEVPTRLYQAVAEIVAYVYKLKNKVNYQPTTNSLRL